MSFYNAETCMIICECFFVTVNGSNPMIELAYRATVEYNMTDFTPASVKDLVDR